jgi:beta-glucosidase
MYGIFVGKSSRDVSLEGMIEVKERAIVERTKQIFPKRVQMDEMNPPEEFAEMFINEIKKEAEQKALKPIIFSFVPTKGMVKCPDNAYGNMAKKIVEQLTDEQLAAMVVGEIEKSHNVALGAAGIMVPGTAGETSGILEDIYDIPGIAMADGPAGLRLMREYQADVEKRKIYTTGLAGALENGFFAEKKEYPNTITYYQYCTAFPVGTMLAQTWNTDLVEKVGNAVGVEMEELGIALWLAPGMNIHRNPLCGRNFEYYSEDPLVSGLMAAAITNGVQKNPGVGTTIKHFACNNREFRRMESESILSERALREIYLRGFEIAVKKSQPMAIMTSYNLVNGVHAANCYDLCTVVAREEWGFQGFIMTDWTTTSENGGSIPWRCIDAGNDLIMPGQESDAVDILNALQSGKLEKEKLKISVYRLLKIIFQTLAYEDCKSYQAQFLEKKI